MRKNTTVEFVWRILGALVLLASHLASPLLADEAVPANPQPRWWKGNIHTHTFWSDGNDFPEMVAEWYRTHGYNFLAISDHNVLAEGIRWKSLAGRHAARYQQAMQKYLARFGADWVETRGEPGEDDYAVRLKPMSEYRALVEERGRFLVLAGEEISDQVAGKPVHMNATNLKEQLAPLGGGTVREAIAANLRAAQQQAKKTGREILVHLNHPNFGYAVTAEDLAAVLEERFFEVYNGHPLVGHAGDANHPSVERLWDIANTLRIGIARSAPLYGVATDDSHEYHHQSGAVSGRGWIMVRARHLTPESLIRAIKKGDFYASSGVSLRDVRYDSQSRTLSLEIEPDGDAEFTTQFIGTREGFDATSRPRTDSGGKPVSATRRYSSEVGQVLAERSGRNPRYTLRGDELYVRAVVTSTKAPKQPSFDGQLQQAWTQPVGWQSYLALATQWPEEGRPPEPRNTAK